jgi:hypothetical protein
MEKWKSNNRIPTFPRLIALFQNQKRKEINPGLLTSFQAHLWIRKRYTGQIPETGYRQLAWPRALGEITPA